MGPDILTWGMGLPFAFLWYALVLKGNHVETQPFGGFPLEGQTRAGMVTGATGVGSLATMVVTYHVQKWAGGLEVWGWFLIARNRASD